MKALLDSFLVLTKQASSPDYVSAKLTLLAGPTYPHRPRHL